MGRSNLSVSCSSVPVEGRTGGAACRAFSGAKAGSDANLPTITATTAVRSINLIEQKQWPTARRRLFGRGRLPPDRYAPPIRTRRSRRRRATRRRHCGNGSRQHRFCVADGAVLSTNVPRRSGIAVPRDCLDTRLYHCSPDAAATVFIYFRWYYILIIVVVFDTCLY